MLPSHLFDEGHGVGVSTQVHGCVRFYSVPDLRHSKLHEDGIEATKVQSVLRFHFALSEAPRRRYRGACCSAMRSIWAIVLMLVFKCIDAFVLLPSYSALLHSP